MDGKINVERLGSGYRSANVRSSYAKGGNNDFESFLGKGTSQMKTDEEVLLGTHRKLAGSSGNVLSGMASLVGRKAAFKDEGKSGSGVIDSVIVKGSGKYAVINGKSYDISKLSVYNTAEVAKSDARSFMIDFGNDAAEGYDPEQDEEVAGIVEELRYQDREDEEFLADVPEEYEYYEPLISSDEMLSLDDDTEYQPDEAKVRESERVLPDPTDSIALENNKFAEPVRSEYIIDDDDLSEDMLVFSSGSSPASAERLAVSNIPAGGERLDTLGVLMAGPRDGSVRVKIASAGAENNLTGESEGVLKALDMRGVRVTKFDELPDRTGVSNVSASNASYGGADYGASGITNISASEAEKMADRIISDNVVIYGDESRHGSVSPRKFASEYPEEARIADQYHTKMYDIRYINNHNITSRIRKGVVGYTASGKGFTEIGFSGKGMLGEVITWADGTQRVEVISSGGSQWYTTTGRYTLDEICNFDGNFDLADKLTIFEKVIRAASEERSPEEQAALDKWSSYYAAQGKEYWANNPIPDYSNADHINEAIQPDRSANSSFRLEQPTGVDLVSGSSEQVSFVDNTEQTAAGSTEQTAAGSTEQAAAESTEQAAVGSTEQAAAESTEQAAAESTEQAAAESTEQAAAESAEQAAAESAEQAASENNAQTGESSSSEAADVTA